jgi:hypothetical protein
MNLATTQGRALEHFRESVSGCGIEEVIVHDISSERPSPDIRISLLTIRPLTLQQRALIHRSIEKVNRRFGTRLQVDLSAEEG